MQGEVERKEEKATTFLWKLKAVSLLDDRPDSFCCSPDFHFDGRSWRLELMPHVRIPVATPGEVRKKNQTEDYLLLHLRVCDADPPTHVRYSLRIRKEGGKEVDIGTGTFDEPLSHATIRLIRGSELLPLKMELLPEDIVTVVLELRLEDRSSETVHKDGSVQATVKRSVADVCVQTTVEESVSCGGKGEPSEKTGVDKVVEDDERLWPNSGRADVVLKVKHAEFKAHRTILAARTPVLGAMFHHDTTERASGEVSIDDCEPKIFEQLLHYVCRVAPGELTAENAPALYVLADKYLVSELKALCVRCMADTLCLDTFCDTLTLSLMHREDELLKTATDFFSRNMIDVLKTVQWQSFMHQHTTWANEMLIRATELTASRCEKEKRALLDQPML